MRASLALALALPILLSACVPGDSAPTSVDGVVFHNARYRIIQEVRSSGSPEEQLLRVRLEAEAGWHFAEEAPVGLRLGALPGYEFAADQQRSGDALERSEQRIEFESGFRVSEAGRGGGAVAADVKFGLCSEGSDRCEIIERKIELHLPATL